MRILIHDGTDPEGKWEALEPVDYGKEWELQKLLNDNAAELLPPDPALDEPQVVYAREVMTAAGPIDLVGIGSSGSITIMECKLADNPQIRREVVAQVLDYAGAIWEMEPEKLAREFKARSGADPFEQLRARFTEPEAFIEDRCRAEVARRLRDGDFRLVIAVDRIGNDLRRLIRFINSRAAETSGLRLVAVEFPRFARGSVQVLVPETFGDETTKPERALNDVEQHHRDYWVEFDIVLRQQDHVVRLNTPKAPVARSHRRADGFVIRAWNLLTSGASGVSAFAQTEHAIATYRRLAATRHEAITARLSALGEVEWYDDQAIAVKRTATADATPKQRETWPALMTWMAGALNEMSSTLDAEVAAVAVAQTGDQGDRGVG